MLFDMRWVSSFIVLLWLLFILFGFLVYFYGSGVFGVVFCYGGQFEVEDFCYGGCVLFWDVFQYLFVGVVYGYGVVVVLVVWFLFEGEDFVGFQVGDCFVGFFVVYGVYDVCFYL